MKRPGMDEITSRLLSGVEESDDAIYLTDRDGTILYANAATTRITQYTRDELVGNSPSLFASGLTSREYYQRMWAAMLGGEVWREAITNRRADGTLYQCTQSITPLMGDDGEVVSFFVVQRDMSRRSSVQYEMRRAQSELERALEEQETLLREMRHRVKNDLMLLRSMLSLQEHQAEDPRVREALHDAAGRAGVMGRIYELSLQDVPGTAPDLREFLTTMARHWQETTLQPPRSLEVDVPDVPVSHRELVIIGVIVNELVTNAAKYGGAVIRVNGGVEAGTMLHLVVSDNGPGLPRSVLERTTQGLGLTMVSGLAEQLNGSLTLRNGIDGTAGGASAGVLLPVAALQD
jgi:PAS domain S-box-containing protein